MSEEIQQIGFGFVDDTDESLKSKSGGKFGINTEVFLTKFELNQHAGKDNADGDALDMTFQIGDREFRNRIYPTTRVYKDGQEITDKSSTEYKKAYNDDWSQKNAVIVHVLKSFKSGDDIKKALSVPLSTFKDFVEVCQSLLPDNFKSKPLDVFLEWQWNISDGQERTFLQMPRNMKGGYFVVAQQSPVGSWNPIMDDKGLRYVDDQGNEHSFTRDKNFMESNKANQQIEGEEAADETLNQAAGTNTTGTGTGGAGKPSEW